MNRDRTMLGARLLAGPALALALVIFAAGRVDALPRGYKEDFNGCATQSPDEAERKRCCNETYWDCDKQCNLDFPDPLSDENSDCEFSCFFALDSCRDGKTVRVTAAWPGRAGADIPGLVVEGDRLVPEGGLVLSPGRRSVLVELLAGGDAPPEACAAFVVACECPPGPDEKRDATRTECRARLEGNATTCSRCAPGAPDERCIACPECRPVVLSAQRCVAPEPPARKREGDESSRPPGRGKSAER